MIASGLTRLVESLAELKPVFRPDGEVTTGNCCPLNDSAAAVVVMSDSKARTGHHPACPQCCERGDALNPETAHNTLGLESICVAGKQGMAIVVESLS